MKSSLALALCLTLVVPLAQAQSDTSRQLAAPSASSQAKSLNHAAAVRNMMLSLSMDKIMRAGLETAMQERRNTDANMMKFLEEMLKEFPVDTVKIDCSFVRDMEDDANDEAIIKAVINLGKNLGIKVVAEGIEKMSQAERLIELGCGYGQGFLFSEAVPADRIPPLIAHFARQRGRNPHLKLVSGAA